MFFVGATGQIITLILTVSLPFIFFIFGNHKINSEQPTLSLDIHQDHQEISSSDFTSYKFEQDYSTENYKKNIKIEDSDFIKIPHLLFRVKQKLLYLYYSGKRAPPGFIFFSC